MIEDDITAAIVHPHCYNEEIKRQDAARAAKLAAKQSVEREKLGAWNNLSKPSQS
jgi:hypothetical protein